MKLGCRYCSHRDGMLCNNGCPGWREYLDLTRQTRWTAWCFLMAAALALSALVSCGGPEHEEPAIVQCQQPMVWCEGDPALCPVPLRVCRVVQ